MFWVTDSSVSLIWCRTTLTERSASGYDEWEIEEAEPMERPHRHEESADTFIPSVNFAFMIHRQISSLSMRL
jgi:hypothetical protein